VGVVGLQLTEEELRLAKQWYVDGHAPSEIASRLGRNKSTLTRHIEEGGN
jgi:IS30 family transposase